MKLDSVIHMYVCVNWIIIYKQAYVYQEKNIIFTKCQGKKLFLNMNVC